MRVELNEELVLMALATVQPASAGETLAFILEAFPSLEDQVPLSRVEHLFRAWSQQGLILLVGKAPQLFSLTARGNGRLSIRARRFRDKVRMFLLKSCRSARLFASGEVGQELAGVSPALDSRTTTKEGARPNGSVANSPASGLRVVARPIWPRLAKQLHLAGSDPSSPDSSLRYYSFGSTELLARASTGFDSSQGLGIREIALAIGVSPHLISACVFAPTKHYRCFEIPKSTGGVRAIRAPRVFLKVIQHWILDYLLFNLKPHYACHSYQQGRSILSNASPHIGKRYVAGLDIENFFGTVTRPRIIEVLIERKVQPQTAKVIAALATLEGVLPQGAPTSPHLSNLVLFQFDRRLAQVAREFGVTYSRYADDISLSGDDLSNVRQVIAAAESLLTREGLRVNVEKTRVISRGGQQRVTGVVVNAKAQPPRELRRRVRAMFNHAKRDPLGFRGRVSELRGYLGYLASFPELAKRVEISRYREILNSLEP